MASISKMPSGKYRVRWYQPSSGTQVTRTCPDHATAKRLGLEAEQARALGQDWRPESRRAPALPTVGDVAKAYIADQHRRRRAATAKGRAGMLQRFLAFLAERFTSEPNPPITVLSRALMAEYFDWTAGRAPSTRNTYVHVAELLWAWAADSDDYGDVTPRVRRLDLPTVDATPTVAPTWAECDRVIAEIVRKPPRGYSSTIAHRLAVIMRYTGLRARQGLSLLWTDFDLEAATLTIRGALGKSRQERAGRVIPITPHLVAAVSSWEHVDAARVIPGQCRVSSTSGMFATAWRRAVDAGAIRRSAFAGRGEHAFRKAFVTELATAGADPHAVEYLVGHASGIRGVYLDPRALDLAGAVQLVRRIDDGTEDAPDNVVRLKVSA